jgi:peptidoglycan/LPS O-acetylase OafA/YrhL
MARYAKFLLAVAATIISGIVVAMTGDSIISNVEWVNIAISGVGALAVFAAPNVPGAMYTKSILAGATAALTLLASFITDGVTTSEWLQIAVAVMGALGVYAVPNRTDEARSANPGARV